MAYHSRQQIQILTIASKAVNHIFKLEVSRSVDQGIAGGLRSILVFGVGRFNYNITEYGLDGTLDDLLNACVLRTKLKCFSFDMFHVCASCPTTNIKLVRFITAVFLVG